MGIQGAFNYLSQVVGSYRDASNQVAASVVVKLKELRSNSDIYQKVGQIASTSLQLMIARYSSAAPLTKLSTLIVSAVGMHDFYRIIQYPRPWFFPINADVIEERNVLKDITQHLAKRQWVNAAGLIITNDELKSIVQKCIENQLEVMADNDDAYRSLDEFIVLVQKHLKAAGFGFSDADSFTIEDLHCDTFKWIHHIPTGEKMMSVVWTVVDFVGATWWLKEWDLVDTAKFAETVGQYRAVQWVKDHHLDQWLMGSICTGCAWKLYEAVRSLRDDALTAEEAHKARWNIATAAADLAFFGSIFSNLISKTQISPTYVNLLALCARTIGLVSLLNRPRHQFFQEPKRA